MPAQHDFAGDSIDSTKVMVQILCKQKKGLSICHLNAQSLRNKTDELRYIFEESNVDVICISETWLDNTVSDSMVSICGYKVFRSDRATHAGGVCIYVKTKMKCHVVAMSSNECAIEFIYVEISCQSDKKTSRWCNISA